MKKIICTLMIGTLLLAMTLSIGVYAAIPYDNMIALYTMDNDLKDSISGKAGTLKNGASFIADSARGNVLFLDNKDVVSPGTGKGYDAEGQHAILAESHIPDSDTMTVSIWFKVIELRNWARVIDMGDARAETLDSPNRFINISPTNGTNTIGTVNVNDGASFGFTVANNRDRVFADLVAVDTWVHAVLVIDATDDKPNVLYLNGVAFESGHGNAGDPAEKSEFSPKDILAAVDGIGSTYIGRSRYNNNGDQIFNGYVDDIAIFDIALSAEQVKELMNAKSDALLPAPEVVEEVVVEAPAAEVAAPAETAAPAPAPAKAPQTSDASILVLFAVLLASGYAIVKTRKVR